MKRSPALLASVVFLGAAISPTPERFFRGEIMDSTCAQVGSHSTLRDLQSSHDCTVSCVQAGAKYVLYDIHGLATFRLDDQQRPERYAGQNVMVIGTYDTRTNTIHVWDIEPALYGDPMKTETTAAGVPLIGLNR
jgi:hypothetical protein